MTAPLAIFTADHSEVIGYVKKDSAGWWGTLVGGGTIGPVKSLRACTKRMEKLRKKEENTNMETNTNGTITPDDLDAGELEALGHETFDHSAIHGEGPKVTAANTTIRNTEKAVALARAAKLRATGIAILDKLTGFSPGMDGLIASAADHLATIEVEIDNLPDDAKRTRTRKKRAQRDVKPGNAYEIKEKYRKQYATPAGGDASACVVIDLVDGGSALVIFPSEAKAVVKIAHLGAVIE